MNFLAGRTTAAFSRGDIRITDGQVEAFERVARESQPSKIVIDISGAPGKLPRLPALLLALREKTCPVELHLHNASLNGTLLRLIRSTHNALRGDIEITDSQVKAFLSVGKEAGLVKVSLNISDFPRNLPGLQDLLLVLGEKTCQVHLPFDYDFLEGTLLEIIRRTNIVLTGDTRIGNDHLDAFESVVKQSQPKKVVLQMIGNPRRLPRLPNVILALAEKECEVEMQFHPACLEGTLLELIRSTNITITGKIKITDTELEAFERVADQLQPKEFFLSISGDPGKLPGLPSALLALAEKTWRVRLLFHHDFRFPKEGGSALDGALREFFERSKVELIAFRGQLSASAFAALPSSVWGPQLSAKNSAQCRDVVTSLKGRKGGLTLHLLLETLLSEPNLKPLPWEGDLFVYLSNVEEGTLEEAGRVLAALQPLGKTNYTTLRFPGVLESKETGVRLIEALARHGVKVNAGVTASPELPEDEEQQLKDLAKSTLGSPTTFHSLSDVFSYVWDYFVWN